MMAPDRPQPTEASDALRDPPQPYAPAPPHVGPAPPHAPNMTCALQPDIEDLLSQGCSICGVLETAVWRRDSSSRRLCNACGCKLRRLRQRLQKIHVGLATVVNAANATQVRTSRGQLQGGVGGGGGGRRAFAATR
jgi:hypothetical protein